MCIVCALTCPVMVSMMSCNSGDGFSAAAPVVAALVGVSSWTIKDECSSDEIAHGYCRWRLPMESAKVLRQSCCRAVARTFAAGGATEHV